MTTKDLDKLESTFGIRLPPRYREWALQLPDSDDDENAYQVYPFMDVDVLIQANEMEREEPSDWDPKHFIIGDLDGNYYFIDLTNISAGVFYSPLDDRSAVTLEASADEFFHPPGA